jgi:3-hydroxybutyryl-CoA dehydratase
MDIPRRGIDAVEPGADVRFSRTVSESDIYLFAGITGDHSPNHMDEEYMRKTRYGRRIAHGALLVGFMSTASSKMAERIPHPVVSYGYDRIRFVRPVFPGDTITVEYRIAERDSERNRFLSEITVTNQRGQVVAAAVHILQLV